MGHMLGFLRASLPWKIRPPSYEHHRIHNPIACVDPFPCTITQQ